MSWLLLAPLLEECSAWLLHDRQNHRARALAIAIDTLHCLPIVRLTRLEYVGHEALRVSVVEREPGTLHLHHDAMPLQEHVIVRVQADDVFHWLVRGNWLRTFEAFAEPAPEDLAGDHQLVSAHDLLGSVVGRSVLGIDVDE